MTNKAQSCQTCRYWIAHPRTRDSFLGACRRNPPQVIARVHVAVGDNIKSPAKLAVASETLWEASEAFTRFPSTMSDEWCGQWMKEDAP